MNRGVKKLLFKLILFAALVTALQVLVYYVKPQDELPNSLERLVRYAVKYPVDVLYLGDSVVYTVHTQDVSRLTIGDYLQKRLPDRHIGVVTSGGFHMNLFLAFSEFMAQHEFKPQAIIIEINPAGMSPHEYPPEQRKELLASLYRMDHPIFDMFYQPLGAFHCPMMEPDITMDQYFNGIVYDGEREIGRVKDFEKYERETVVYSDAIMRIKIIMRYLFPLARENKRVQSMLKIADVLKAAGIRPVYYITPVDYQRCEEFFPGRFTAEMAAHSQFIRSLLKEKGCDVLDLSLDLESRYFFQDLYPNEHLREEGRKYVAKRLSEFLGGQLSSKSP